jgi:C4-type Zn-finger protein
MSAHLSITTAGQALTVSSAQAAACPICNASLTFFRTSVPHIDECGFESYGLECKECGTPLAGIIDPADETVLLSAATG